MKRLFDELSITCSNSVTAKYSTSFSLAVKMLALEIQDPIHAVYGFVRFADEIVDSFHDYDQEVLFEEFEVDLKNALERKVSLNPILNSFQSVVHRYNIGEELIEAFMNSMRLDLSKQQYATTEEYNDYIYGSADVVGLMCLKIFVNGDEGEYLRLKDAAMKLGSAFQKVNFLRDLKDDSELLNRNYFPHLSDTVLNTENKAIIIAEIEQDFEAAFVGIKQLPLEAKFGVYTAYVYYKKLLNKIKRTHAEQIKEKRIRISNPVKIQLLLTSFVNYKLNLL